MAKSDYLSGLCVTLTRGPSRAATSAAEMHFSKSSFSSHFSTSLADANKRRLRMWARDITTLMLYGNEYSR